MNWSETKLNNASIEYFVYTALGWNHNDLYQIQNENNLNKRLAYAIASIMTAKKIDIESPFKLFEFDNSQQLQNELEKVGEKLPKKI